MYYNDLAQNGWATCLPGCQHAVGVSAVRCSRAMPVALPGAADGGAGVVIDPNYHTPYALHVTGGVQYAWHKNWTMSADYVHEQGVHGYRRYEYTAGYTLFSPLFPQDPDEPDGQRAELVGLQGRQSFELQRDAVARPGQRFPPLQFDGQLRTIEREDLGLRTRENCGITSMAFATRRTRLPPATTAHREKMSPAASRWRELCTFQADSRLRHCSRPRRTSHHPDDSGGREWTWRSYE